MGDHRDDFDDLSEQAEPGSLEGLSAPFDAARFREVLGHFATGVAVITTVHEGRPFGFTAQSFTSVSLEPPLVAMCPSRRSSSWPRIESAGVFSANVLSSTQEALARTFATRDTDRFAGVGWTASPVTGCPVLAGAVAWVDCRLHAVHDGGDHLIVVGRVVDLGIDDDGPGPLLFYRGGYGRFAP